MKFSMQQKKNTDKEQYKTCSLHSEETKQTTFQEREKKDDPAVYADDIVKIST